MNQDENFTLEAEEGVSLIEVLIGIVITVAVLGAALTVFTGVGNVWSVNTGNVEQRADARRTLEIISRETRAAQTVTIADAASFEFLMLTASYTDVIPTVSQNLMTIGYSLDDAGSYSRISRSITLPGSSPSSKILSDFVRNNTESTGGTDVGRDLFHYFSSQGIELSPPVSDLTQIYTVRITVILDKEVGKPPAEAHESTTVAIRSSTLEQ